MRWSMESKINLVLHHVPFHLHLHYKLLNRFDHRFEILVLCFINLATICNDEVAGWSTGFDQPLAVSGHLLWRARRCQ